MARKRPRANENYQKSKIVLVLIPEIINTRDMVYEIQKRKFQAGTHPEEELFFIYGQMPDGEWIPMQGPYESQAEAIKDSYDSRYEECSWDGKKVDVQLGLDMIIDGDKMPWQ